MKRRGTLQQSAFSTKLSLAFNIENQRACIAVEGGNASTAGIVLSVQTTLEKRNSYQISILLHASRVVFPCRNETINNLPSKSDN